MFNKNIKLGIAVLLLGYAIYQFTEGAIGNGIFLILLALVVVFLYLRNELILLAFLRMRKQDFQGTKKWLSRIKNPQGALIKQQQGYYYYLNGIITSQINLTEAEKLFKKALQLGLTMRYDRAMAKLSLAGIAMQKRRKREATELIKEAKQLDKHNLLTEQIKVLQQQLKKI